MKKKHYLTHAQEEKIEELFRAHLRTTRKGKTLVAEYEDGWSDKIVAAKVGGGVTTWNVQSFRRSNNYGHLDKRRKRTPKIAPVARNVIAPQAFFPPSYDEVAEAFNVLARYYRAKAAANRASMRG